MNVRELTTLLKFKTDMASVKSAEATVTRIKNTMSRIKPATLKVNTGNATKSVNALNNRLNQLAQPKRMKINVDSSQVDKATESLNRLAQAQTRASQSHFKGKTLGLAQGKAQNPAQGGGMGSTLVGGLKAGLVALGGMAIVNEIKETADAMMSLSSRIKLVTKDDAERLKIEQRLYQMSMKNRSSMADLGDLYYKTASASMRFGASQEDVLRLTDIVSKSLIIGGADTVQQKSTILQLSQALGSGVLQGDELRSLRENAPKLMEQIANYFNTDMGGLKEMGAKGELTTEKLMKAILSSGKTIDEQFGRITPTIGQAITTLGNKWQKFILDVQNSTGIFGTIAGLILDAVDWVGEAIDFVKEEFKTIEPEFNEFMGSIKELWTELQPLLTNLGEIFKNWIVPALRMFGKVALSVLSMVADLLKPIADLLGKIAGLIADASNGFSGLIKKAESGAIEKYNNIMTEYNQTQNNNITVSSPADAGRVMRDGTFFSRHR